MNNLIKNNSNIPDNKIIDKTFDKLTIFGSAQLLVPKQMSYIDKKGNKKIINTVQFFMLWNFGFYQYITEALNNPRKSES